MSSKMDPYVIIETREQKLRTKTKQSAGKTPVWNEVCHYISKLFSGSTLMWNTSETIWQLPFGMKMSHRATRLARRLSSYPRFALIVVSTNGFKFNIKARTAVTFTWEASGTQLELWILGMQRFMSSRVSSPAGTDSPVFTHRFTL